MSDTEGELTTGDTSARPSSDALAVESSPHGDSSKIAVLDKKQTTDVIEQAQRVVEDAENSKTYDDLFKKRKIDELLALKDKPEAQFRAFVLLTNNGHSFNPINEHCQRQLAEVDIDLIAPLIGLTPKDVALYKEHLTSTQQSFERYKYLDEELSWESKSFYKKDEVIDDLRKQIQDAEKKLDWSTHAAFFRAREKILLNPNISDEFKIVVIEGLQIPVSSAYGNIVYETIDKDEDKFLKTAYESSTSDIVKQAIKKTTLRRLGHDPNAIDIIPFSEYEDQDKMFIAAMGNRFTTRELVETKLAPLFFPDRDPKAISRAWDTLVKVTWNGVVGDFREVRKTHRFGTDGSNFHTNMMNRDFFLNFVDNADKLIPLVDTLADYGFFYAPVKWDSNAEGKMVFSSEYVFRLIELSEIKDRLQAEIKLLQKFHPNFTYNYHMENIHNPMDGNMKSIVIDNPFAMVFDRYIKTIDEDEYLKAAKKASSLFNIVPEHWRDSFVRSAVLWLTNHPGANANINQRTLEEIMVIANKMLADPNVSQETFEIIGTSYLKASLRPEARNIEAAFQFLQNHAHQVVSFMNEERVASSDHSWLKFVMSASDLYRYNLTGQDDEEKIALGKRDFNFAYRALSEIKSPELRDLASEQLVYAYTDIDYRDLERAREIAALVSNDNIRKHCEEQIGLEIEREEKGETSAWKKMESVRRNSAANTQFLVDLLGFSTQEACNKAYNIYHDVIRQSPPAERRKPSNETVKAFEVEKERIKASLGLSINLSWDSILQTLDTGRLISIWENEKEMYERNTSMSYHYATRRDEIERKLNNRAKGGARDPHPVYGAAWSPNGRDEFFGPAWRYGGCFVKLRTDRIKDRTTATYDDSFNGFNDYPMLWEDMASAEAMLNLTRFDTMHRYVETQILGGVTTDDIESINIPRLILEELEYKSGPEVVTRVMLKIEELKQRFPNVVINIIEEANAKKMLELLPIFYDERTLIVNGDEIRKHYETIAKT